MGEIKGIIGNGVGHLWSHLNFERVLEEKRKRKGFGFDERVEE